jgi:Domain of unknown function (DUF5666)
MVLPQGRLGSLLVRYNVWMVELWGLRRVLMGVGFLCAAALLALPASAQDTSSNFDLEGKITQESKGRFTVDSGQGILFHVAYDEKASIVHADSSAGSEQDLKVGVKVHVIGDLQDSGEIKAQRIEIESSQPKSESPPASQH